MLFNHMLHVHTSLEGRAKAIFFYWDELILVDRILLQPASWKCTSRMGICLRLCFPYRASVNDTFLPRHAFHGDFRDTSHPSLISRIITLGCPPRPEMEADICWIVSTFGVNP